MDASIVHRISGRQYDLFFISLTSEGRRNLQEVVDPKTGLIPNIRRSIQEDMKARCSKIQERVYDKCAYITDDNDKLWRNTGANGGGEYTCWTRYKETCSTTFAVSFGRVDLTTILETPGQFWSRHARALVTGDPRVASAVSIPLHRYKIAHFRNDSSKYTGDFYRYRFEYPFVLITFVRIKEPIQVLPYCNWVVNKNPELLSWSELNSKYTIPFKGNGVAIRKEAVNDEGFWKEVSELDRYRTEVFLSLMDTAQIVVKSEFKHIDDLTKYLSWLRSGAKDDDGKIIEVASTESVLSLNRVSKLWQSGTPIADRHRSLSFRILLKYRDIRAGQSPIDLLTPIKQKLQEVGIKQNYFGAMPQYYDYCVEWTGITTLDHIAMVYDSLLELNRSDNSLDAVTIPVINNCELNTGGGMAKSQPGKVSLSPARGLRDSSPVNDYPQVRTFSAVPLYGKWLRELYDLKFHHEWLSNFVAETRSTIQRVFPRERQCDGTLNGIERFLHQAERYIQIATERLEKFGDVYRELPNKHSATHKYIPEVEKFVETARGALMISEQILDLLQDILHDDRDLESVLAMSPPILVPFKRTGSMDLHHTVAQKLVRHYLNNWKPLAQPIIDNISSGSAVQLEDLIGWNGIVHSAFGKDLSTFADLEVLLLPIRANYEPCEELPLIAHEVGHILLRRVEQKLRANDAKEYTFKDSLDAAHLILGGALPVNNAKDALLDLFKSARPECNENFQRYVLVELFCDIFAMLTAGPSFGVAMHRSSHDLGYTRKMKWDVHFSLATRLHLAEKVQELMGYSDKWDISRLCRDVSFQSANIPGIRLEAEEKAAVGALIEFLLSEPTLLRLKTLGLWDAKQYEICERIAVQLAHNDAIVIMPEWNLSEIVAAAQMQPILRRPCYPSGRILLSIAHHTS